MVRREFFAFLGSLPIVGWFSKKKNSSFQDIGTIKSELKTYCPPKLRIWSLGSLEHRIVPSEATLERLAKIVREWDGISPLDVIWGPELRVQEFDLGPGSIDVVQNALAEVKSIGFHKDGTVSADIRVKGSVAHVVEALPDEGNA